MQLFCFFDGDYFLVLIEASNIEYLFEIYFLRYWALPLWGFRQLLLEFCVYLLEVLPLLPGSHEEQLWELWVVLLELISEVHRHRVNIVGNVEVIVLLLHFLVLHDLAIVFYLEAMLNLSIGLKVVSQELLRVHEELSYFCSSESFGVGLCNRVHFT